MLAFRISSLLAAMLEVRATSVRPDTRTASCTVEIYQHCPQFQKQKKRTYLFEINDNGINESIVNEFRGIMSGVFVRGNSNCRVELTNTKKATMVIGTAQKFRSLCGTGFNDKVEKVILGTPAASVRPNNSVEAFRKNGDNVEVIPVKNLNTGDKVFEDRKYTFANVDSYPAECFYVRALNNDKRTKEDQVQLTLEVNFPSQVYLDYYESNRSTLPTWTEPWDELSDSEAPTPVQVKNGNRGPWTERRAVFKRTFEAGRIEIMGNESPRATALVFVCPEEVWVGEKCTEDEDCILGKCNAEKQCVPVSVGERCEKNDECTSGKCMNNRCVAEIGEKCTKDDDCISGQCHGSTKKCVAETPSRAWESSDQNMIWSDAQCNNMKAFHRITLNECKLICEKLDGCTAINYSERSCYLRKCTLPVPTPHLKSTNGFQGHYIADGTALLPVKISVRHEWMVSEQNMIWSDAECANVGGVTNASLEECKVECEAREGCTGINYSTRSCYLRTCTFPVAAPQWKRMDGFQGHYIMRFVEDPTKTVASNRNLGVASGFLRK